VRGLLGVRLGQLTPQLILQPAMGVTRAAICCIALAAAWSAVAAQAPAPVSTSATGPMVIGSRAFSPMVEDVDKAAAFYKALGLIPDPAGPDGKYPWDKEPWHYQLHGGQAPRSQMRYMYAKAPGAVPPATPLLVEPVEHKDIDRYALANRVADPGVATLVLLVRDLTASAAGLPASLRQPVRAVTAYGSHAKAMTVAMPGGHLVELLQPDLLPLTTAPEDAKVIGGWVRFNVRSLERTLRLYRDDLGLVFAQTTRSNEEFGRLLGTSARVATAVLPQTGMKLEFVEVPPGRCECVVVLDSKTGKAVDSSNSLPRIQDPGAVRLQLTVRDLEKTLKLFAEAGPSAIVSSPSIITQPNYRVNVLQDFNGLFLVLTDNALPPH
jgi:catechol 2,3-dioxygenase-like lactoylglutathione lyase family enzyme